jgi:Ohr subfamily peroxiredoxin
MPKAIYTAQARVTGGRQRGRGRTSDGALDVQLRLPNEGGGTNPEQLFAVGYAACFEAAMTLAAQRLGVPAAEVEDASIESSVMLLPGVQGALKLGAELAVELPSVDDSRRAVEIVRVAHGICPYSNATRGNIDVKLSVNGVPLESEAAAA